MEMQVLKLKYIIANLDISMSRHHHYLKSQIFVQKFNFTKPQHFHEFFAQIFFDNFSREIKVVNS